MRFKYPAGAKWVLLAFALAGAHFALLAFLMMQGEERWTWHNDGYEYGVATLALPLVFAYWAIPGANEPGRIPGAVALAVPIVNSGLWGAGGALLLKTMRQGRKRRQA